MTRCFSLTESRNWCYRSAFAKHGLHPVLTDLHDGFSSTVIHLYLPKSPDPSRPNLLIIHGLVPTPSGSPLHRSSTQGTLSCQVHPCGAQLRWIRRVQPGRSIPGGGGEGCGVMRWGVHGAGGPEGVQCDRPRGGSEDTGAGDARPAEGAGGLHLAQGPPVRLIPSCLLNDFIDALCIFAGDVHRLCGGDKGSCKGHSEKSQDFRDPKDHPGLLMIVWGEHDLIFLVDLAYRLKEHVRDNAQLPIIKDKGHACNVQKPKEFYTILKSFLFSSGSAIAPVNESPDCKQEREMQLTVQN